MSVLVSAVLLGIALAALPVSRRLTGDLFTPTSVIVSSWCGALSLYLLRLLPYPPMHPATGLFLLVVLALITIGAVIGQRLVDDGYIGGGRSSAAPRSPVAATPRSPTRTQSSAAPSARAASLASPTLLPHADRWVIAFSAIGLAGTLWYGYSAAQMLGWRMFIDNPLEIRLALGSGAIASRYLFLEFFCIIAPTLALALVLSGARLSKWAWTLALLAVLATWVTTDRTHFFTIVLVGYFMALFQRGRALSTRTFLSITTVALFALVANFLLVGVWLGKTPKNLNLTMALPGTIVSGTAPSHSADTSSSPSDPESAASPKGSDASGDESTRDGDRLARPGASWLTQKVDGALQRGSTLYLYTTGSFAALDGLLYANRPRTHGLHTFYPIGRALERLGLIDGPMPPAIAPFLPLRLTRGPDQPYNVYTFLFYPLEDFGIGGALLYAFAIGVLSGGVFAYARAQRGLPVPLLLIGHLYSALLLSIFVNKFNNTASWYVLIWSLAPFWIARGMMRRRASLAGAGGAPETRSRAQAR